MSTLRRHVRLAVVGGALAYRALFNWTSPSIYIPTLLVSPILGTVFFAYVGRYTGSADDTYFVIGNTILAVSGPCLFGGVMALANERRFGTLASLVGSPAPRATLLIGRSLPYIGNGLLVAAVTFVGATLLLNIDVPTSAIPSLLVIAAVSSAATSLFGIALGAIGMRARDVWTISNVVWALSWLVCGANVPRDDLPTVLRSIGAVMPMTHAITAARSAVSLEPFGASLIAEAALGLAWLVVAVALLRYFEYAGRRSSALDLT